jgi:hypothetical protein
MAALITQKKLRRGYNRFSHSKIILRLGATYLSTISNCPISYSANSSQSTVGGFVGSIECEDTLIADQYFAFVARPSNGRGKGRTCLLGPRVGLQRHLIRVQCQSHARLTDWSVARYPSNHLMMQMAARAPCDGKLAVIGCRN